MAMHGPMRRLFTELIKINPIQSVSASKRETES